MRSYSARLTRLWQEYDHLGPVLRLSHVFRRSAILQKCPTTFLCRFNQRRPPKNAASCSGEQSWNLWDGTRNIRAPSHMFATVVSDVSHEVPMTFQCVELSKRMPRNAVGSMSTQSSPVFLCLAHRTL